LPYEFDQEVCSRGNELELFYGHLLNKWARTHLCMQTLRHSEMQRNRRDSQPSGGLLLAALVNLGQTVMLLPT